jgi:hypothetical protein
MVRTQAEAKRFFVDKVLAQAGAEGMALSDAEQKMLFWSEPDPDSVVDLGLPERLAGEISDTDYEKKIVGLLSRSFQVDVARSPEAEAQWKEASRILHQGDHYIVVMLDEAVRVGGGTKVGCVRFAWQSVLIAGGWLLAATIAGAIIAKIDANGSIFYLFGASSVAIPAAAIHILLRGIRVFRRQPLT